MPYPNEHAARVVDPKSFDSFARKEIDTGITAVFGIKDGKSTIQAYRFNKKNFTPEQAKKWIEDREIKIISFENASNDYSNHSEQKNDEIEIERDIAREDSFDIIETTTETPEGFLLCKNTILTRSGIFEYFENGRIVKDFRPPEEVFNKDSIATFSLKPATLKHPLEKYVDNKNARFLQTGSVGETFIRDGENLRGNFIITDELTKKQIKENGLNEISCGYVADMINVPGEYNGEKYDRIQTNIRYNHLAVGIKKGRAGNAKIKIDSKEKKKMATIVKNDVSYEVDDKFVSVYSEMKNDAEQKTKTISELQAKLDASTADKKKLEEELRIANEKKNDEKEIIALAEERAKIIDVIKKIEPELKTDEATILELKKKIISSQYPDIKLDGKDENYFSGIYDAAFLKAKENLSSQKTNLSEGFDAGINHYNVKNDAGQNTDAYQSQMERINNLYKRCFFEGEVK